MPELVFYDQRLPLKRKWSEGASPPPLLAKPLPMQPQRPLPRLPSLSAWANVKPAPTTTAVFPAASVTPSPASVTASVTTHATSPPPVTKPPSPPVEKKPAAPMRNTSRERMKAEQASLRAQAATLETELSCLRQLRHERLSASLRSSGSSSCSSSEPPSDSLLGWQEMAQRHWDQRVASERENKRLREAVNGLATEVKGLEALFNSRSSALMASLKQNALLAVQIQELLHKCERSPQPSPTASTSHSTKKLKTQPPSSASSSHAQSPRDVACAAMEAPQSPPYGL